MADTAPIPERAPARELLLLRTDTRCRTVRSGPTSTARSTSAARSTPSGWPDGRSIAASSPISSWLRPREEPERRREGFCRETGLSVEAIRWRERIYDAHVSGLLQVLAETAAEFRRVMLVGHNPGFEELAGLLAHGDPHRVRLATAAAARIRMPEDWSELSPDDGEMVEVVRPPKR